ncbi:hypothetical protein ACIQNG_24615 [Streptomyces sp. NPDC091377]|uniref:hypothetical protein n=1 Tax=unclassified Streptomyces TaxID=2593676 RepID=UPI003818676D
MQAVNRPGDHRAHERSANRERVVRARDEVISAYRDDLRSVRALAEAYGVGPDWLQGCLIEWRVPLRDRAGTARATQERTRAERRRQTDEQRGNPRSGLDGKGPSTSRGS